MTCAFDLTDFKVGDPAPKGYVAWHEWARVQYRGGLRQKRCKHWKWRFPREVCKDHE